MRTTTLATALELARFHGVKLAAAYLCDAGVSIDVAVELLATNYSNPALCHGQNMAQEALRSEAELIMNPGRIRRLWGGGGLSEQSESFPRRQPAILY
jgi:hypothetical protein